METKRSGHISVFLSFCGGCIPVSVNVAGVDVVGALQASDWLQADPGGFIGHDVDQSVLELVARQIGCHEPRCVGFGIGQALKGETQR